MSFPGQIVVNYLCFALRSKEKKKLIESVFVPRAADFNGVQMFSAPKWKDLQLTLLHFLIAAGCQSD